MSEEDKQPKPDVEVKEEKEPTVEEVVEDVEKVPEKPVTKVASAMDGWTPKTGVGHKVKNGEIYDIDVILDAGLSIREPEIVDMLLPEAENDLLLIGQSKGKFGGGQRRVFKQTQKKTMEGNKPSFSTIAIVGDRNGHIGMGCGKAKETVPAREKAFRKGKLNLIKISRGCGSWACGCATPHSIPFEVKGKCGSITVKLMPAPKGTGLCAEGECAKILKLAGVKDVWAKIKGHSSTKANVVKACFEALNQLTKTKVQPTHVERLGMVQGGLVKGDSNE